MSHNAYSPGLFDTFNGIRPGDVMPCAGVSPSPGSWASNPLSSLEIDAHPDCDRIWATVMGLQIAVGANITDELKEEVEDLKGEVASLEREHEEQVEILNARIKELMAPDAARIAAEVAKAIDAERNRFVVAEARMRLDLETAQESERKATQALEESHNREVALIEKLRIMVAARKRVRLSRLITPDIG